MISRAVASLALGAVVILGATGCNMIAPQATTIEYSPAEGVHVPNASGPVDVLNAFVVANEDGSEGSFVATFVNETDDDQVVRLQVAESNDLTVRLEPREVLSLGVDEEDPLEVTDLDALPGQTVALYVQSGDGEGATVQVPVLDGAMSYLEHLAP